jgi:hypothetical protein
MQDCITMSASPPDQTRLSDVIQACSLTEDLERMPLGIK